MAGKTGIDISVYQGDVDFSKVKDNVSFIILRAGYGKLATQKDKKFETYYGECKKYGIPVGVYWFSYAKDVATARKEAEACLEVIKGKTFEYPIYFDVEGEALTDKKTVVACCKEFCGILESAGYYAGVYMSRSPAQTYLDGTITGRYALWLAEYGSRLNWSGSVGMWQSSSTGKIPGIAGNVDTDVCYIDYPSAIKAAGLNGYKKGTSAVKGVVLDKTGLTMGDKGIAVLAYKQLLIAAKAAGLITQTVDNNGTFGEGTLNATNEVLAAGGYYQNGIAGEEAIKFLGKILKGAV